MTSIVKWHVDANTPEQRHQYSYNQKEEIGRTCIESKVNNNEELLLTDFYVVDNYLGREQ